jgi:RHS repeat-associated protein
VANYANDNSGRATSIAYPSATAENVTYTYDSTTSGNKGIGRLTSVADQSGSTALVYDALGRVTSETRVIGSQSYTTAYAYDVADHLTEITYPSGRIVTFARNSLGQVSGVTTKQNSGSSAVNVATSVTWKPMSDLLAGMIHGNGLTTTAGYDLDYRLTSLLLQDGATNISSLSYTYTDGLNLTAVNDNVTAANSASLSYSPANRLSTANGAWGNASFTYDGVGNRLTDVNTVGAVTTTRLAAYDTVSNRITGMTENSAALRSYTYDAGGNIITDTRPGEVFAFTYNARNRPASVTRNSVSYATYGYNAFEQLVSRATSAVGGPTGTVHYIHDLDGHIIAEADASTGATVREYLWMASNDNEAPTDLPLAVVDEVPTTPVLLMVHTDHLGRPIRMTDGTKATVWAASYKPWGEVQSISGTRALNLRFPGQYFQIETNLAYNWHRHYDLTTGRYTQPDPLRFVDGPSIYAYAGNSPFMETDREGRSHVLPYSPRPVPTLPGSRINPGLGMNSGSGIIWPPRSIRPQVPGIKLPSAQEILDELLYTSPVLGMCFKIIASGFGGGGGDDDCKKEWEEATDLCRSELEKPNPNMSVTGGYYDIQNCAKGHVSQRCGGNIVEQPISVRRIFGRSGGKFKPKR